MKRSHVLLTLMLASLALVGCNDSVVQVTANGESYAFRRSMVLDSRDTHKVTSDKYSPLILIFKGADIKKSIREYPIDDDVELTAQVYFNYDFDIKFAAKPYLMTDEFDGGTYEHDPVLGLYRVFNKYYKVSKEKFSLLTKKPSSDNPVPSGIFDFYEGSCLYLLTVKDYACEIYMKIGKHAVLANTGNLKSLNHRDALKKYIMKIISEAANRGRS